MGILLSAIALVAFGSTFFYREGKERDEENLVVVTSFYPMYIATENLVKGREHLTLESLSEPQTGCLHDYQLTPEDMKLLAEADIFVVNGGGIEEFLTDVAKQYPDLVIVNASEGVELLESYGAHAHEEHVSSNEGDVKGAETTGDLAENANAHAWMSIPVHRQQLKNICSGLSLADPAGEELYRRNLASYDEKLAALQEEQEDLKREFAGRPVVLFHEAYAYVAKDYGMHVLSVMDLDEERQISAGEVAQVMDTIKSGAVPLVLAEEQYGKKMGDMVERETSADVCYLDTLVRGDYDSDSYVMRMEKNISILRETVR